ncbi:MAG: hypothetical protein FWC59_03365, partial [Actinomycetia bacterium]|nr:hypothetical protein [Actinomycetes bacterium]
PELAQPQQVEYVVQINSKVRARLRLPLDVEEAELAAAAQAAVAAQLADRPIRNLVVVPGRLVNFVV